MTQMKERLFWGMCLIAVLVLFILSSTDLVLKEEKTKVYTMSVILDEENDRNYTNLKRGMEHAAIEYQIDISFISLYNDYDSKQQIELIERELQADVEALVIYPVNQSSILKLLDDMVIEIPFVLLNDPLPGEQITSSVYHSDYQMGSILARNMEADSDEVVYVYGEQHMQEDEQEFLDGISATLDHNINMITNIQSFQELATNSKVIALNQDELSLLAKENEDKRILLYGKGTSLELLNYLEDGQIQGLCVTDDFLKGYESVRYARLAIENANIPFELELDSYYIGKEDLITKQFEKMLYPIQ